MKIRRRYIILLIIGGLIAISAIYFAFGKKDKVEYVTAQITKGSLVQTVSEVGTIRAAKEIELNFSQTGKISKIMAAIGDQVKVGQILAELDYGSLMIKEKEAQANLQVATANLNKLLVGATAQEIAISQAQVTQARANYLSSLAELEETKRNVAEDISQAEESLSDLENSDSASVTASEQAVNNKRNTVLITLSDKLAVANTALDKINTVLNDPEAENMLSVKDPIFLEKTKTSYSQALILLAKAEKSLNSAEINSSEANIDLAIRDSLASLDKVFESLDYCYGVLEKSLTSYDFSQTELDSHKTNISAQSTLVGSAISAVQTAQHNFEDAVLAYDNAVKTAKNTLTSTQLAGEQKITVAQSKADAGWQSWQVAKTQLDKLKYPARSQDVSLYQAQVRQAEASLELIKKQIEDSIIEAPIDGTIIRVNYEVGEQLSAAKSAMAMLGENNFEIEVDISEADIYKIKVGNAAEITLDSFGDEIKFAGKVLFIEPAETIIQDVTYYKVKVELTDTEEKLANIKSGMTANVIVTTNYKKDVLLAPARAVIEKNGDGKYVRVLVGSQATEKPVETGLRGDEGLVEIISGVKEGETVVTFEKPVK